MLYAIILGYEFDYLQTSMKVFVGLESDFYRKARGCSTVTLNIIQGKYLRDYEYRPYYTTATRLLTVT